MCDICISHTDSIKDLGVLLGTTFFFQSLKMLGFIHAFTDSFSTNDNLLFLYFTLIRSKLEYAMPAWNIMTTNANKLECVKWKFAAVSFSRLFPHIPYNNAHALELLKLHTIQVTSIKLMLFFLFLFFPRPKFCPSIIDNSSVPVPSCNIRNFIQFSAGHNNFPSTRHCKFGTQ